MLDQSSGGCTHPHWPRHLPRRTAPLQCSLYTNLVVSAMRHPDKPALIFNDVSTRYAQLLERVDALAGFLEHRLGVAPQQRVVLFMQNCPQFVIAYYAVLRCGAVVVPVNPMSRTAELDHVMDDTGAAIVICGQEMLPTVQQARRAKVAVVTCYDGSAAATPASRPAPCDDLRVHNWDDAWQAGFTPTIAPPLADSLCMILYSSGSTGRPKGCMYTHRALANRAQEIAIWSELFAASNVLASLPMFHIGGIQPLLNAPLFAGSTIIVLHRWDATQVCQLTGRYRVSHWHLVPAMLSDLMHLANISQYDLRSVQRINAGGAAVSAELASAAERLLKLPNIESYGMSETCGAVLSNPPQHARHQCLGIPIFGTKARLIDPETLTEVPAGQAGELVIHNEHLFSGYWNNPRATEQAMVCLDGERYFRTGDIARTDGDGYFFMVDRIKRMVNSAGYKVWPAEVESVLMTHPAVQEACVIGRPDMRRGELVKALIVLKAGQQGQVSPEAITDWARSRLAAYKVPKEIDLVVTLPRTASGKVDWRQLQEAERHQPAQAPLVPN